MFHDAAAPAALAIEAFTVTAASLYGWCNPADVDAALATLSTGICPASVRQTDARN